MTARDLIVRHEGNRARKYQDQDGHWTIGVGHNLDAKPLPADLYEPDGSLSAATVDEVLDEDMEVATADAEDLCQPWWSKLDPVRQAVILDMSFEMGRAKLATFSHFLGCAAAGNYASAARAMMQSLWATQVPLRASEDARMMQTGEWPDVTAGTA